MWKAIMIKKRRGVRREDLFGGELSLLVHLYSIFLVIHDFFANRSWAWHLIDEYVNHDNMALADFKKNKRILKIFRHSAEMFLPTQIRKINV